MAKDSGSSRSDLYLAIATIAAAFIIGIFTYISNKPEEHLLNTESEERESKTYIIENKDARNDAKDIKNKTDVAHPVIKEQSALELKAYLDSLPPLQRETIFEEHYQGKWVAWSCYIRDVMSSNKPGYYIVICSDIEEKTPWISIDFSEKYYDQIQSLRDGDKIFYHAKIEDMTPIYFLFTDGELLNY